MLVSKFEIEKNSEEEKMKHMKKIIETSETYMILYDMPKDIAQAYAISIINENKDLELLILKLHMRKICNG